MYTVKHKQPMTQTDTEMKAKHEVKMLAILSWLAMLSYLNDGAAWNQGDGLKW